MAKMPDLKDYNPDEPFEGLGFLDWCKVVFRTRAQSLKQSDAVTHALFKEMQALHTIKRTVEIRLGALARLTTQQHEALVVARETIQHAGFYGGGVGIIEQHKKTLAIVDAALDAALEVAP